MVGVGVGVLVAHTPITGVEGVPVVVGSGGMQTESGWTTGGVPFGQIAPQ